MENQTQNNTTAASNYPEVLDLKGYKAYLFIGIGPENEEGVSQQTTLLDGNAGMISEGMANVPDETFKKMLRAAVMIDRIKNIANA